MSSRYFIQLAYNGNDYCGWQKQPEDPSIQVDIEKTLSTIYNQPIQVVGCGRTDAGVHASYYFLHTDLPDRFQLKDLVYKLNNMLGNSIRIYKVVPVASGAHARFDALSRSYTYKLVFGKDPFNQDTVYRYDQSGRPDFNLMNNAARLLLDYDEFLPFCKTHADNETNKCKLTQSEWQAITEQEWHFHITSDRFLRGMVRLIVGMCLNVGLKRLELEQVKYAMDNQVRLEKAWSVPAKGLYLSQVTYPYIEV